MYCKVMNIKTGDVHAVYASGSPLDGSLYGFETLCEKTVLDTQEADSTWRELESNAGVSCLKCLDIMMNSYAEEEAATADTAERPAKLLDGEEALKLLSASTFVELHYTDSITQQPTARIIPVKQDQRENRENMARVREIILTRGQSVGLKNFKLRFNRVIDGKANLMDVEFKHESDFSCPNCDGNGEFLYADDGEDEIMEICYECNGTGRLPSERKAFWIEQLTEQKMRAEKWLGEVTQQLDKLL